MVRVLQHMDDVFRYKTHKVTLTSRVITTMPAVHMDICTSMRLTVLQHGAGVMQHWVNVLQHMDDVLRDMIDLLQYNVDVLQYKTHEDAFTSKGVK